MSDPVSGTTVAVGGLMGASMFGLTTGIDRQTVKELQELAHAGDSEIPCDNPASHAAASVPRNGA